MKRYRAKSIFKLFLISYLIILILPALLASGLYYQAYVNTRDKYIESGQGKLSRAVAYFEQYLEQLDSMSVKLAYDTQLEKVLNMKQPEPGESSVMQVVEFSNRARDMLLSEQNSSYTLILKKNEFIFTNTSVNYGLDFFYSQLRKYDGLSAGEVIDASFSGERRSFIPIHSVTWLGQKTQALTYNYALKSYGKNTETMGVVQYLIPVSYIEDIFENVIAEEMGELQIYSETVGCLGALGADQSEELRYEPEQFVNQSGYIESKERESVALYCKASDGLVFVYNMPRSVAYEGAYELGKVSFIAALMCTLVEIALGWFFAWKYSAPLKNILRNIKMLNGTKMQSNDEYHQLQTGVQGLIESNQDMQTVLKEQQERQKRDVINQILNGWLRNEENVRQTAEQAGIPLGTGEYCIVLFRADEHTMQRKMSQAQGVSIEWAYDLEPNLYAMMVREAENDTFSQWLEAEPACPCGVGKSYGSLQDLVFSYQQALYVLETNMTYYKELPQEHREAYFPDELEERLMQSVKHAELDNIEEIFRILEKENVMKRTLSGTMVRILQADLASTYMKVRKDIIFDPNWQDPEELFIKRMPIEDMLVAYAKQFCELGSNVQQAQKDKKDDIRSHLLEYLEMHFGEQQLCVAQMAEVFGFSESYFSQFFKEATGESFSISLERIRLEHAKIWLKEGHDVESITQMTGYTNSGSFRRAFKRYTGVSPSVWKQENV